MEVTEEVLKKHGFHYGYTSNEEDFMSATGIGGCDKGWCYDQGTGSIKIIFPTKSDGGVIEIDDESFDKHLTLYFCKPIEMHNVKCLLDACDLCRLWNELHDNYIDNKDEQR